MKRKLSDTAWMIKEYMTAAHIISLKDLADDTGIEYRTLMNHINDPGKFRIFELRALDKVLKFRPEDLISLTRGENYEARNKKIAYFGGSPADNDRAGHDDTAAIR